MRAVAAVIVVLALVIGILPQFTDCQSQGRALTLDSGKQVPMKCHWTGQAEIAVAVPLALVGLMLPLSRRREGGAFLGFTGVGLGAVAILLPTMLIGVCASPDMLCHSLMRPALVLSGSLVVAAGLVGVVIASRRSETP
ncbi:MAG: DUF4418 family protein [Anaerolineae bacterium]